MTDITITFTDPDSDTKRAIMEQLKLQHKNVDDKLPSSFDIKIGKYKLSKCLIEKVSQDKNKFTVDIKSY